MVLAKCAKGDCSARCAKGDCSARCAKGDCSARCAKGDCSARCAKGDCSALCAPAISASIRNPGCRPAYSCWLGCQMCRQLCVQARGLSVRLTTLSGQKKLLSLIFKRQKRNFCGTTLIAVKKTASRSRRFSNMKN